MAAAPFLVRRFVEPAVEPRAVVWIYLGLLLTSFAAVLGMSIFLFLFLAPHALVGGLGTTCVHGTYCLHALPPWVSFTLWLLVVALLGWLFLRAGWTGVRAWRASQSVRRAVVHQATPVETTLPYPVYVAADRAVFALTVGFRRPIVLVSQGLRGSLSSEELEVVLAHEEAHVSGRDNVLLLVSRMIDSALFFFPGVSRAHAGVRRYVEISADAFASQGTGDRLLVAMSVNRVARLLADSPRFRSFAAQGIGAAFAHGELAVERVRLLAADQGLRPSRRRLLSGIAALVMVLAVFGTSLYLVTGNSLAGDAGTAACVESASE